MPTISTIVYLALRPSVPQVKVRLRLCRAYETHETCSQLRPSLLTLPRANAQPSLALRLVCAFDNALLASGLGRLRSLTSLAADRRRSNRNSPLCVDLRPFVRYRLRRDRFAYGSRPCWVAEGSTHGAPNSETNDAPTA